MLAVNKPSVPPSTRRSTELVDWPKLDNHGNNVEDVTKKNISPEKHPVAAGAVDWRARLAKDKTGGGGGNKAAVPPSISDNSSEDDLDREDEEMLAAIRSKMEEGPRTRGPGEQSEPGTEDHQNMLKFKSSLFSRNVMVVNNTLKKLMKSDKELEEDEDEEDGRVLCGTLLFGELVYVTFGHVTALKYFDWSYLISSEQSRV